MIHTKQLTLNSPTELVGEIELPGSKSETNRLLLLGALLPERLTIYNPSQSDDSNVIVDFLQKVGISVVQQPGQYIVTGHITESTFETVEVDLQHGGAPLRFITAFSVYLNGTTILTGSPQLMRRPIEPLVESLKAIGAEITYLETPGRLPIKIVGDPFLRVSSLKVDASQSSQMLTALLLLAPLLEPGVRVFFHNSRLVSEPYITMTLKMLAKFGLFWEKKEGCFELLEPQVNNQLSYQVEGDWSSASYWLAMAATRESKLCFRNLFADSLQGDAQQLLYFNQWDLSTRFTDDGLVVKNTIGNVVQPFDFDFRNMPDLAPTFAVLACFAERPCRLTGLETLVHKESNRVEALCNELSKGLANLYSARVQENNSQSLTLNIEPLLSLSLTEALGVYGDHRLAMAFSILANLLETVTILDPDVVSKSYPNYWKELQRLGFELDFNG